MPVDRSIAEGLASTLAELYRGAETRLAQNLAGRIRSDVTHGKLTSLGALRRQAEDVLAALSGPSSRAAEKALMTAYARGAAAAVEEMERLSGDRWVDFLARRSRIVRAIAWLTGYTKRRDARLAEAVALIRDDLPGIDYVMVIAQELNQRMSSTHMRVLRWQQDSYRGVMAGPVVDVLLGTKTRLRAAQVAWEDLLSKGVTGFTDKRGRDWDLASYTEMATRTAVSHASIEGHLNRLTQAGAELVIVSNAPEECKKCRPYEARVLAVNGPAGPRTVEHALQDGVMITIDVKATVAQALAAGLMHPQCRHRFAMWLPGVTKSETHTQDPQGDKDRQRLRELERRLRRAKLKREAAIDPAAEQALGKRVRDIQAQIREHVRVSGAQRQPAREAIGSAR